LAGIWALNDASSSTAEVVVTVAELEKHLLIADVGREMACRGGMTQCDVVVGAFDCLRGNAFAAAR
jgi:hypothetical protein